MDLGVKRVGVLIERRIARIGSGSAYNRVGSIKHDSPLWKGFAPMLYGAGSGREGHIDA
jgi:hypothetical protein